jgi:hypothetical protein
MLTCRSGRTPHARWRRNNAFARAKSASTSVDAVRVAHHEESALADDEMVGYASKTNSERADRLPSSKKVAPEDCLRRNASTSVDAVRVAHHEESALADDEMVGYAPKINSSRLQPATLFREGVSPSALNHARQSTLLPLVCPHVRHLLARVFFSVAPLLDEPRVCSRKKARPRQWTR